MARASCLAQDRSDMQFSVRCMHAACQPRPVGHGKSSETGQVSQEARQAWLPVLVPGVPSRVNGVDRH
eukprot:4931374-Pyramimonas_sp.AAC.1